MKRSDIKTEDKWDLSKIYQNNEMIEKDIQELQNHIEEIKKLKGQLTKRADNLYSYLINNEQADYLLSRLYVYAYLKLYEEMTNNDSKILVNRIEKIQEGILVDTSFANSELLSCSYDKIKEYIKNDKRLEKYSFLLERIFRFQKYNLSPEVENVVSLVSNAFGTPQSAFEALDNEDVKFGSLVIDNEDVEVTHSNYIKLLSNSDHNIRKQVFEIYYQYYKDRSNTITQLYKGNIKEDLFYSKVRKYDSSLEMSLFQDAIDVNVYKNLIESIHNNLEPFYEYMKYRKKVSGLDELHMYDMVFDLIKGVNKEYSFEEAKDIVLDALKVLGEEYVTDLNTAFTDGWIDKYPNEGKRSGAYQWGCYGTTPYVSLNFEGTNECVSTMAHELGHAMHSFYSDKNQEFIYSPYPIFLAEIASTVNEVLLNNYMIENAKTDDEKKYFIISFIDRFRTTVYRQTMFAEFEMKAHEMEQNGEAITTESLCELYYNLNKLYYGDEVISDESIKYEWMRIPHFYTSFYVYKYATGFFAALAIASSILNKEENALDNYIQFLSSGGSNYPLETLKKCGVDMTTSKPIEAGINMFKEKLLLLKEME